LNQKAENNKLRDRIKDLMARGRQATPSHMVEPVAQEGGETTTALNATISFLEADKVALAKLVEDQKRIIDRASINEQDLT
jgi:hypothetical protein